MIFATIIIYIIIFLCINKFANEKKFSKLILILYSTWWYGLLLVAMLQKSYYEMSIKSTVYLLLIPTLFIIGYLVTLNIKKDSKLINKFKLNKIGNIIENKKFNNFKEYDSKKITWIIGICLIIILLYYKSRYDMLLDIYGVEQKRLIKYNLGMLFQSPLENIIYIYIIEGIINIFMMLLPIHIMNKKYKNPTIYISLILLYLSFCIGEGRLIIIETMFYFIICFIIYNYKQIINIIKNKYKIIISILSLFIVTIFFLSLKRYNTNFKDINSIIENSRMVYEHIFMYFTGPFKAFDYAIMNNYRSEIVNIYGETYGLATFAGLDEVIRNGFNFIGIDMPILNRFLGDLTQRYIEIGPNVVMNAFFTCGLNFYIDYGLLGIIIIPLLYGSSICLITRVAMKYKNVFLIMFLILNIYYSIFSSVRWYYQHGVTWITFLFILFMFLFRYWSRLNVIKSK